MIKKENQNNKNYETRTESAEDCQKRIIDLYIEEANDREVYY